MNSLDIDKIKACLPHRYPFLLIDKVLDYDPHKSLTAIKNVTVNEPFFQGHFPNKPVMPGVLIIEAMAQATGLLGCISAENDRADDSLYYLVAVDNARFRHPVEPGDQLVINVDFEKARRGIWCFKVKATVDKEVVASADLMTTKKDPTS
ncbi:3-hydroxyacyl-[acyl-carrier-protein] dehydratase [Methylohalomonas lacus]|uniref:3-hydroxyacyl-[acyl-carrier-protein] dehydratase FabZ n=2 Tax=Methylohalomonas lacus TaxID=398773 RepID=A0AAE3L3Q3_9GAMM|nr:3-hydroxyacyl-[acyl-carrier-protein] dehydratase [Methylohalomonas lacus]